MSDVSESSHRDNQEEDPSDVDMEEEDDDGRSSSSEHVEGARVAPSRLARTSYFRQQRPPRAANTQKRVGKIFKTVQECYIRNDLGYGCCFVAPPPETTTSATSNRRNLATVGTVHTIETVHDLLALLQSQQPQSPKLSLWICDANVLIHNLDVVEQAQGLGTFCIPQTALLETKRHSQYAYDRIMELIQTVPTQNTNTDSDQQEPSKSSTFGSVGGGIFFPDPHHVDTAVSKELSSNVTSPNDDNDARIRSVASFYYRQLQGTNVNVCLLTDDAASRQFAKQERSYQALSVSDWVATVQRDHDTDDPRIATLSDLVAHISNDAILSKSNDTEPYFEEHWSAKELSSGIHNGSLHRGIWRSTRGQLSVSEHDVTGLVTIRRGEERVAVTIRGWKDRNRAMEGDVVAIALNPLDQWLPTSESNKDREQPSSAPAETKDTGAGVMIASETAEPSASEIENVRDSIALDAATGSLRPTGRVVGILRRNFVNLSGSIFSASSRSGSKDKSSGAKYSSEREKLASQFEKEHSDGSVTCVFFPVDQKIPPILIRTSQRERLIGQRITVSVDSWPLQSSYPLGHYVRTIGPVGSKDVETQVLLQEHDIPYESFSAAVLACLPPEDYRISAEDSPERKDLRHLPVLSIDPPNCKDIDDALHCSVLPNGNFQVGVHIADVTHYVKAGTAMDLEAANRSTSTYLVNRRLDMLPGLLTTDLCSLKGNVDRYAFSVLWEVTPDAEIINVDFQKTIIHSIAALTYQQAQAMIDQEDDPDDIQACAVKGLASLAKKFRKRRIDAGALTLASPEVKFVLDSESLNPTDVQAYALLEANAVVEEFMLLANVTVSKKILRHYPTLSVLRRHPAPNRAMFDGLISKAKSRGFTLDIEDSKKLADSLDAAVDPSDPYINKLLRILSTRCMSPAQYFCSGEFRPSEWQHYGLAAPVYTHFTSPIRRYADVCVHRLLAAAIGVAPLPRHLSSKSYLHDLCANMNRRHRSAQLAGRASVQLHTLIFFAGDGEKEEDAYVLDVETNEESDPSLSVIVPRYGIEGKVKLPIRADDPNLVRSPEIHRLSYSSGSLKSSVQVFEKVRVRIWVRESEDHQRDLVLDLLDPQFESTGTKRNVHPSEPDEPTKSKKRTKTRR